MASRGTSRGAHALGDDHRKAGGWWKWLLAALLLIAAAIILIALLSGGDDTDNKASKTPPAATTAGAEASAGPGTLTADGRSLLGAARPSAAPTIGAPATGTAVTVLSVDAGDGFFVGTSTADRVYVEYGAAVGTDEPAQDYKATVGDTVDLTGPVRPAPQDPAKTLRLNAADAQTVAARGFFVNAMRVTKTP